MATRIPLTDFSEKTFCEESDTLPEGWEKLSKKEFEQLAKVLGNSDYAMLDGSGLFTSPNSGGMPALELRRVREQGRAGIRIRTGGYIGKLFRKEVEFRIGYRFGEVVLERMIAKAAGFDDFLEISPEAKESAKSEERLVLLALAQQFVLAMERAAVLGLPQSYRRVEYHERILRGQIDMPRFIQKDIPFLGRISSVAYERWEEEAIVDLLDTAFKAAEKINRHIVNSRVLGIRNYLRETASRRYLDGHAIERAKSHRLLKNPLYAPYKEAVKVGALLARFYNDLVVGKDRTSSLLFDVSKVWESYLYAVIRDFVRRELPDKWRVFHEPELSVYESCFFARKMKPDIVLLNESEKKALVLDAKSKRMTCRGGSKYDMGDLDREDFFQMHTYMSYYEKQGYEVLGGGLVYPMEKACENGKKMACGWFGGEGDFFVEGVVLSGVEAIEDEAKKLLEVFCGSPECDENTNKDGLSKSNLKKVDTRLQEDPPCWDEDTLKKILYDKLLKKQRGQEYYNANNDKKGTFNRKVVREAIYAIAKCKQAKMIERAEEEFWKKVKDRLLKIERSGTDENP